MKHSFFAPRSWALLGSIALLGFGLLPASAQQSEGAPRQRRVRPPVQQQEQVQERGQQQAAVQQSLNVENLVPRKPPVPTKLDRIAAKLKIGEPQTHANLTIFPIEGEDRMDTRNVLTLSEALGRKGMVEVKETGNVNELTVQNFDPEFVVFIMAGDIVKGGKQDRTLGSDLPLTKASGVVPIGAFCVEQGRWRARGAEDVTKFTSSANAVATKEGKVALRRSKAQNEVWDSVAKAQAKISGNVGKSVAAAPSPTSLQLSLEDKELKRQNEAYIKALKDVVEKNPKALGFVCVINGYLNGAEIFAGHDLFRRAWPKLLEAASTEAISELKEKKSQDAVTIEKAMEFLAAAEDASATKEQIHKDFWSVTGENDATLLFQTIDESMDDRWMRRSILKK